MNIKSIDKRQSGPTTEHSSAMIKRQRLKSSERNVHKSYIQCDSIYLKQSHDSPASSVGRA